MFFFNLFKQISSKITFYNAILTSDADYFAPLEAAIALSGNMKRKSMLHTTHEVRLQSSFIVFIMHIL